MARPDIIRGTYVTILMGQEDGPPETFAVLCGITAKSLSDTVNTSDTFNRDCADPEDAPVRQISATGRQWSMRGSGNLNRTLLPDLDDAVGVTKSYRFFIARKATEVSPKLNGYYGGEAMITSKVLNGDDGGYLAVDLTFESDGEWTWTDVP
jgi:hypothetical protein